MDPSRLDPQLIAGNKAEAKTSNFMNNAAFSSRTSVSLNKDKRGETLALFVWMQI